jgi:nucleotide-binding universal stress UspA family protein
VVVVSLDAAGAIHEALRLAAPALACMATHGRGRSAALLGSVAMETLARGHDPLILIGPFVGDGPRPESEPRGVMVCVDQSPFSELLVADAFAWAAELDEPLVIVTVAEPAPPPLRPGPVHRRFGPDGDVGAFLAALAAPVADQGVDVVTQVIWDPVSPADGLRQYLEERPAFLTVAGSHPRAGPTRLAFGSVAFNVVRHSRSPVMVVPKANGG